MKNDYILTVGIPTYNRKDKLIRTLSGLQEQTNHNFFIYISDNNSNYDIEEILRKNFPDEFVRRTVIHKNRINVGADHNIVGLFNKVTTDWLWTLSDDDFVEKEAIDVIYKSINEYPDASIFDYPSGEYAWGINGGLIFNSLEKYIDFAYKKNQSHNGLWGSLIFLSNKVYNISRLIDVLPCLFEYSYTHMATAVLIIKALEAHRIYVIIDKYSVVKHDNSSGLTWSIKKVYLGMRTISDVPLNLDKEYLKKLYSFLVGGYTLAVQDHCNNYSSKYFLHQLYDGVYKYYLPFYGKIELRVYVGLSKSKAGRDLTCFLVKIRNQMRSFLKR